jgi:hypothetical protein
MIIMMMMMIVMIMNKVLGMDYVVYDPVKLDNLLMPFLLDQKLLKYLCYQQKHINYQGNKMCIIEVWSVG